MYFIIVSYINICRCYDRRVQSKSFKSECHLTSESFTKSATTVRISDLLRLMLSCSDAMVLTDKKGRIIHCNRQWVELTGYTLSDVEGSSCGFLQGSMTDYNEIKRCGILNKSLLPSQMKVVNYRKDGLMFTNHVTTAPIKGGFMNDGNILYVCMYV
jgi:PAS domain S-box-containing protein